MKKIKRVDTRKKNRLKHNYLPKKISKVTDLRNNFNSSHITEELYEYAPVRDNENTLDSNDPNTMASMNDFLKGYNMGFI